MNKTEALLQTISSAMTLQNETAIHISKARSDINDVNAILEQIRKKVKIIDGDLNKAENDTKELETKRDILDQRFKDNRKKLTNAEEEADKAEDSAKKVKSISEEVRGNYNETKMKLDDKVNMTNAVRERVMKLADGAVELFATANLKLQLLEDLKQKYIRNEEHVQDLLDELRKLEIQAEYIRDTMETYSSCHASCNPDVSEPICVTSLEELRNSEQQALAAHEQSIKNRDLP